MQRESIFEWLSSVYQSYSSALPGAGLGSGSERKGVFSDGLSFLWEHILILGSLSTSEKPVSSPSSSLHPVLPALWMDGETKEPFSALAQEVGDVVFSLWMLQRTSNSSFQVPLLFLSFEVQIKKLNGSRGKLAEPRAQDIQESRKIKVFSLSLRITKC